MEIPTRKTQAGTWRKGETRGGTQRCFVKVQPSPTVSHSFDRLGNSGTLSMYFHAHQKNYFFLNHSYTEVCRNKQAQAVMTTYKHLEIGMKNILFLANRIWSVTFDHITVIIIPQGSFLLCPLEIRGKGLTLTYSVFYLILQFVGKDCYRAVIWFLLRVHVRNVWYTHAHIDICIHFAHTMVPYSLYIFFTFILPMQY